MQREQERERVQCWQWAVPVCTRARVSLLPGGREKAGAPESCWTSSSTRRAELVGRIPDDDSPASKSSSAMMWNASGAEMAVKYRESKTAFRTSSAVIEGFAGR